MSLSEDLSIRRVLMGSGLCKPYEAMTAFMAFPLAVYDDFTDFSKLIFVAFHVHTSDKVCCRAGQYSYLSFIISVIISSDF